MQRYWKRIRLVFFCMILLIYSTPLPAAAWQGDWLELAFIRNGKLWVKQGGQERPITADGIASWPSWSPDGKWIAYLRRESVQADLAQLWLYDTTKGRTYQVQDAVQDVNWSPTQNLLAYRIDSILTVTDLRDGHPRRAQEVVPGVGEYSWLPDGSGFLVSAAGSLGPMGWSPSELYKVIASPDEATKQVHKFYTLPTTFRFQGQQFLAVGTSRFKWSADGKWISFLATQTASLSADENVLCLLSSDGKTFVPTAEMLAYDRWFKWSPQDATLGVIAGIGRFSLVGKRLQLFGPPFGHGRTLTPNKQADRSFDWLDAQTLLVSRSAEPASDHEPLANVMPKIFQVHGKDGTAQAISSPQAGAGDFDPQVLSGGQAITWVRWDRRRADIWVADRDGSHAKRWVEGIGEGQLSVEHWHWDSVISWKKQHDR
ncbi:TolB-like translocation protein [Tumebacillus algifaecis]|nr:PD40 domain-containing protein [Tumebacillus algifaecis]